MPCAMPGNHLPVNLSKRPPPHAHPHRTSFIKALFPFRHRDNGTTARITASRGSTSNGRRQSTCMPTQLGRQILLEPVNHRPHPGPDSRGPGHGTRPSSSSLLSNHRDTHRPLCLALISRPSSRPHLPGDVLLPHPPKCRTAENSLLTPVFPDLGCNSNIP